MGYSNSSSLVGMFFLGNHLTLIIMIESDDQPNDSDIFTRMAAVEYRLIRVEFRLARIENTNAQLQETIAHVDYATDAFERVVDRIDEVENRLNARMNEHFAEVNKRFDSQDAKLDLTLRAIVGEVNRIITCLVFDILQYFRFLKADGAI